MAQHWTQVQIDHEKQILTNQLMTKSGRFAIFVLRTYRYIAWECQNNHSNWCYADRISGRHLLAYVYNGPADHMGREVVEDAKDKLKKMGYIAYRKEDGRWKLYIKKEIDFCDIRQYVTDTPEDPDFFDRVYQHLLQSGIKIYTYPKTCWNCHQSTDIYTYFLSRQLEEELGKEYAPQYHARVNLRLYERIGLGSLEKLDVYLSHLYPQIQKRYSREMDRYYHMCCCSHCGAHQGINFTVYRPEELMENKVALDEMIDRVIDIRDVGIDKKFIKRMY